MGRVVDSSAKTYLADLMLVANNLRSRRPQGLVIVSSSRPHTYKIHEN